MPSEVIRRAVLSMDGLKGCPRGDTAIEKRGDAFEKILTFRKCLNSEAIDRAALRIVNEFDEFPTPRQFADIVQSSIGGKTLITDPVYIAEEGYSYVVDRSYAHYHGFTMHASLYGAEKEALTQPSKFKSFKRAEPVDPFADDVLPLEDYA